MTASLPAADVTPRPEPLVRDMPPESDFPIDALGETLSAVVRDTQAVIQAPLPLVAQSFLAAASLASQAFAEVEVDGRRHPLSGFFLTVGESGERKSAVDAEALSPVHKRERDLADEHQDALSEHEHAKSAWEAEKRRILADKKLSKRDREQKLRDDCGPPPAPPLQPAILIGDPTIEGVYNSLRYGQPSQGLFNDEGGTVVGGHALNDDNQLKTAAILCKAWDGSALDRVRGGEGSSKLYGRRASLHLMMQPRVAGELLGREVLRDQGLLSRCLTVWPVSTIGYRPYVRTRLRESAAFKGYFASMMALLERPPLLREGTDNELDPVPITLSDEAMDLWIAFHDAVETSMRSGGRYQSIRGLANKSPQIAARLAGVLTVFEAAHESMIPEAITPDCMANGITLMRYYLDEALRITTANDVPPEIDRAMKLLRWLREQDRSVITSRTVCRFGPNQLRSARAAREAIGTLADYGWLVPIPKGAEVDGTHAREAWGVIPQ